MLYDELSGEGIMEPSVTYLPLLATTPFFTRLSRNQLQWVINNSKEWNAITGMEISTSGQGPHSFWVLLDGSWQVEHNGKSYKAWYGDPGKWYGGEQLEELKAESRLIATENSY